MGKVEFGTLYPFDVQPAGNGAWDMTDARTSKRQRFKTFDEAIDAAKEARKEYATIKNQKLKDE